MKKIAKKTERHLPYKIYGYINYCQECGFVHMEKKEEGKLFPIIHYECPCKGYQMLRIRIDSLFIEDYFKKGS